MSSSVWMIQTAFLGDAVLSLPFLARLLEARPRSRVDVICAKGGEAVFRLALERGLSEHVARVHVHVFDKKNMDCGPRGLYRFVQRLRRDSGTPESVYCLQRSFRSGVLALLSGSDERVGFSSGAASFLYTQPVRRDWNSGVSEVEKNLDLLRANEALSPVQAAPWDPQTAPSLLAKPPTPKTPPREHVVLSLGSPWATKRWPIENAAEYVRRLNDEGLGIVLTGDASAKPLAAELLRLAPSPLVRDLTGQTSIPELVDLISQARLVVSGDSAAVHIASDVNTPVMALFGPTLPEFGFAPWRRNALALGVKGLYCRPCDIHGPAVCPEGHHRCLREISGDSVARQSRRFLG